MARPIYLDYAAATPLDKRVFSVMGPYLSEHFYNPSALYSPAHHVRTAYEQARHDIAGSIGAKQYEIILTAGATESINLAIHGVMSRLGGHIVSTGIEHHAVLETVRQYEHTFAEVSPQGLVTADSLRRAITPETTLVTIGYINNELGTVQPLRDLVSVVEAERERRLTAGNTMPIFIHTDASQAAGLLDIAVSRLGVDMMTLNAAKCYGPKQVGLLWVRSGIELTPILHGGQQERGLRAGTENVAGAIGFAEALRLAQNERKTESHRLMNLRNQLRRGLADIPGIVVNGHAKRHAPHILHISVPGLDGERAVYALDMAGVYVATGSACAANNGTRSHVLTAVGMDASLADGSLRISFGRLTTEDDIDLAAEIIRTSIAKERTL